MPTEDYLSLIELDVDLKQISLVFNYEKMMMMILLTGVYRLLTAHRTYLPNPHRTYCRNTRRCQLLYARCARPHADGRPACTPPSRWTPGVHAPRCIVRAERAVFKAETSKQLDSPTTPWSVANVQKEKDEEPVD